MTADAVRAMAPRREGERKLGETVRTLPADAGLREGLRSLPEAGFALVLVPSDLGILANLGRPGAAMLPHAALRRLLAMQDNPGLLGERMVVVGEVSLQDLMQKAAAIDARRPADRAKLHALVSEVDDRVARTVEAIAREGRVPIVFGGGHENAFGVLAGLRAATGTAMGCANLDTHADLRADRERHSGNPFSAALEAGHLARYGVIGLQEPFLNACMWERLHSDPRLLGVTLESLLRAEITLEGACQRVVDHLGRGPVTLEVDLDVVAGMPASASTPSGLDPQELRRCVHRLASGLDARALHVCEGWPGEADVTGAGKLAAMVARDFMQACLGRTR